MKNYFLQVPIVVFSILFLSAIAVPKAHASFFDQEQSLTNTFSVTTLDFSLSSLAEFSPDTINPNDISSRTISIIKNGIEDFKYNIQAVKTSGDDNFCNALEVEAKLDGITKYNGSLMSLNLSPLIEITSGQDDWEFIVSFNDTSASLQNKTCEFDFIFQGWQLNSDTTWGFDDEEIISSTINSDYWASQTIVINEIMWMGSDGQTADEWIELRNTTAEAINITDWVIEGAGAGSSSITLSGTIPANGFFLISYYATSSSAISDSIAEDQVTTAIFLDDAGEQLTLKTSLGAIIDQTPTGSWAAGVNGPPEWKSMERNDNPTTGWHTCHDSQCNDTTFWDSEANNFGTPKSPNLSDNDPSSKDYQEHADGSSDEKIDKQEDDNSKNEALNNDSNETTGDQVDEQQKSDGDIEKDNKETDRDEEDPVEVGDSNGDDTEK